jgi:hypothetical protein
MSCQAMHPIHDLFLKSFSYVLQIDMHFICTPMWTKFYSCKKWVLQVIKLKKEFQDLKWGSMSVNEYITKSTQLSRYALHEVDTDEKEQECFLNDLNDGLAYALEARDFENLQGMVNKALVLESCRGVMEHKHKLVRQH